MPLLSEGVIVVRRAVWDVKLYDLLAAYGHQVKPKDADSTKKFGINWKMTSKTILVQLHHKISTFEHLLLC